jgi:hypothetical protein
MKLESFGWSLFVAFAIVIGRRRQGSAGPYTFRRKGLKEYVRPSPMRMKVDTRDNDSIRIESCTVALHHDYIHVPMHWFANLQFLLCSMTLMHLECDLERRNRSVLIETICETAMLHDYSHLSYRCQYCDESRRASNNDATQVAKKRKRKQ